MRENRGENDIGRKNLEITIAYSLMSSSMTSAQQYHHLGRELL
jgi:hypothetical protein